MAMKLTSLSIAKKIPIIIVLVAMVAIASTGLLSGMRAEKAVSNKAEEKLTAVLQGRKSALADWLKSIEGDLDVQANNPTIKNALREFSYAWKNIKGNPTEVLQKLYITDNPNKIGEKDNLDDAKDGSHYSALHRKYHPYIHKFLKDRGYYDVFLFDTDGNLVYTVFKERDYATNLLNGKWSKTDLGNAFRAANENRNAGYKAFFDFRPYKPSYDAPASFISTPVFDDGNFIGVLAFQMPIGRMDELLQNKEGLGETGETYLVGRDKLMRSDSRFSKESTILKQKVDTKQVNSALAGKSGLIISTDYHGQKVVSAYAPLKFNNAVWAVIAEEDYAETFADVLALQDNILTQGLIAVVIFIVIGWLVGRSFSGPISKMTHAMSSLAKGNLDEDVPATNRGDEIGQMAHAVEIFKENAIKNKQMAAQIEQERKAAEEEKQRAIKAFSEEISRLASAASAGDLSARLTLDGKEGELLAVSKELNQLVATVESGLDETVAMLSALSRGDLTQRMIKDYQGAFLRLKNDSNATAEQLGKIAGEISQASELVQSATSEIAEGTRDLASRTEQQASSLEETAAAMEQLTETVRQNATNAAQANQLSSSARETAEKGGDVVSDAVSAMSRIEESSQKITEIVSLIEEIAFQTNLLALNAAVEAARAGEAGSGFAVVASEVRALAQRSSNASREIKDLIDASSRQVGEGVKLVNHTGETLSEIVTSIKSVADIVSEIASASQEQSTGLNEINTAIASMDEMTQKNAALVEETTAAAQSMRNQTASLSNQVAFFNTGKAAVRGGSARADTAFSSPNRGERSHSATGARAVTQKLAAVVNGGAFDQDSEWKEF